MSQLKSEQKIAIQKISIQKISIGGMKIATVNCGIKYKNRDDLLLVIFEKPVAVAGLFTSSTMSASPVVHCQKALQQKQARALIVNAGNANAFTGEVGEAIVQKTVDKISSSLNATSNQIFVSSTGVIGELFDVNLITQKIDKMILQANDDESMIIKASKAIMTTDTKMKLVQKKCLIDSQEVNIIGFAKGSGMIAPNMATMLGYIFTDANVSSDVLQKILADIVEKSFNSITVDSDQSTNDTVLAFATATAKHNFIDNAENQSLANFKMAIEELAIELAKMIVIDGEGAKKLIEINVINATNYQQAKIVAMAIANSPLVKSAMAASDPNWGRIIMAIGKSTTNISPQQIKVKIGDFLIAENGSRVNDYNEANVHEYLKREEVKIIVDLGINKTQEIKNISASQTMRQDLYSAIVWGCDLNEEYVKINKDYRS